MLKIYDNITNLKCKVKTLHEHEKFDISDIELLGISRTKSAR